MKDPEHMTQFGAFMLILGVILFCVLVGCCIFWLSQTWSYTSYALYALFCLWAVWDLAGFIAAHKNDHQ